MSQRTTGRGGSKTDAAYELVKGRILDGSHPPGMRLPLGPIADELGISTLPAREALRRLEAEGLVRFERNIGATVAGVSEDEREWTIETLAILDGAATAMSLPTLTEGALAEARQLNERLRDSIHDEGRPDFRELEQQFHDVLIQSCGNPAIQELIARSWTRLKGRTFSDEAAAGLVAEHDELLEMIATGQDPLEIEMAVRHHHIVRGEVAG